MRFQRVAKKEAVCQEGQTAAEVKRKHVPLSAGAAGAVSEESCDESEES
jgi:hypothetical protein